MKTLYFIILWSYPQQLLEVLMDVLTMVEFWRTGTHRGTTKWHNRYLDLLAFRTRHSGLTNCCIINMLSSQD